MTTPAFNPALHPRAGGGRFGQSNSQIAQGEKNQLKQRLNQRATADDKQIAILKGQLHQLRAALTAAHATRSHAVPKKSAKVGPRGSKSGIAKKGKSPAKIAATKGKTKQVASKGGTSIPSTRAGIQSKIIVVSGTITALERDATACRKMANQL